MKTLRHLLIIAFIFFAAHNVFSQDYQNLAKLICEEINTVRTQPLSYVQYLESLIPLFDGKIFNRLIGNPLRTKEGVKAVNEAIKFIKTSKSMNSLVMSEGLSKAALDHANDLGLTGLAGHEGSDGSYAEQRINRYGTWTIRIGENISYGRDVPRDIVSDLIIDDGVSDRGHRKNIFNPDFNLIGVALGKHAKYGIVCVITFAAKYEEKKL
ncbi:MAG: allergen V5/TPX-1 family protein [uncultured bacterium]|nr:MAG: allergen V5/TPX-1 family protein [uncultured bacterium]